MQFGLDQVIFTPAATPPHKVGKALAPGSARLAMLELATSEDSRWAVSDAEIRRAGTSFMRLPPFPGSATELRRKVAAGQVTAEELPEGILEVIEREGLYGAASPGAKA